MREPCFAERADASGHAAAAGERAFVARLVEGDAAAFRELLETYWRPLVAYAYRMLDAQDAAEDAAQEMFIALWKRREAFQPKHSLRGYLYAATRTKVVDQLRKTRTRNEIAGRSAVEISAPLTPAEVFELDALEQAVIRAIEALPERRQEVFVLAHLHGLTYQEIADVLGVKLQMVKNHMTLALRDLRAALQPHIDRKLEPLRRRS